MTVQAEKRSRTPRAAMLRANCAEGALAAASLLATAPHNTRSSDVDADPHIAPPAIAAVRRKAAAAMRRARAAAPPASSSTAASHAPLTALAAAKRRQLSFDAGRTVAARTGAAAEASTSAAGSAFYISGRQPVRHVIRHRHPPRAWRATAREAATGIPRGRHLDVGARDGRLARAGAATAPAAAAAAAATGQRCREHPP